MRKNQELVEGQRAGSTRKLIVHADNLRPHTARLSIDFMNANRMTRASHPPHLPDLASSGFLIFGDVKGQLSGCSFDRANDLFTAVREILDGFGKHTLIRVFEEWVKRWGQSIETKGEYVG
jgi:hypothetical protein